jgi:antitoxin component of MazEF toxin-antitoxin module
MAKLRKIGNSYELTVPRALLDDAEFSEGQDVTLDGQITLTKAEATHERTLKAHKLFKIRYSHTLKELAK